MQTSANFTDSKTECIIPALQQMQMMDIAQQPQLLALLISAANVRGKREDLFVKPDLFDGPSSGVAFSLDFYEYACNKNRWTTDEDRLYETFSLWERTEVVSLANNSACKHFLDGMEEKLLECFSDESCRARE